MSGNINNIVNQIADKLGVAANAVIPEYAKLKIAVGTFQMILGIVFIVLFFIGWYLLKKEYGKYLDIEALLIPGILLLPGLILLGFGLYTRLIWSASPTGGMVMEILNALNG